MLVRNALADLKFAELEQLREMPGAVKAICTTLMKVWDADLDLQALAARAPRISDLARIEAYVRDHLPGGMMLQRELVSAAIANSKNAGRMLGSVTVRGFVFVAPCWRRLFGLAAESVQARLISALDDFQASFRSFKRQSALLDFDDLLYFARDLLRTNPAVRAALADRYRHVLVDEFQDTDPLSGRSNFVYDSCKSWLVKRLR
ncbi:MAG: UvrD-helicase domain-containing protein [Candidatus Sulfotelmatobacter sp.]